jgi:hypothetical protein
MFILTRTGTGTIMNKITISVADLGCLSQIPDSNFYILYHGSRTKTFQDPETDLYQRILKKCF